MAHPQAWKSPGLQHLNVFQASPAVSSAVLELVWDDLIGSSVKGLDELIPSKRATVSLSCHLDYDVQLIALQTAS